MWLLFVIAVVATILFIVWRKKTTHRLFIQMEIMSTVANIVAMYRISEKLKPNAAYSDLDEVLQFKLPAICNFLFGHEFKQMHLERFSRNDIEELAYEFIEKDKGLCELVVQSLRVRAVVNFYKNKSELELGKQILVRYGDLYPNSPDPDSYLKLVMNSLWALNNGQHRASAIKYISTTWPNFFRQKIHPKKT